MYDSRLAASLSLGLEEVEFSQERLLYPDPPGPGPPDPAFLYRSGEEDRCL